MKSYYFNRIFVVIFVLFFTGKCMEVHAQEEKSVFQHFSIAANFLSDKNDMGIGINLTTPYFWEKTTSVRLALEEHRFEYMPIGEPNYRESPYYSLKLGLVARSKTGIAQMLYPYMDVGFLGVITDKKISDNQFRAGSYLSVGIEGKKIDEGGRLSAFVEMGIRGMFDAKAEKAVGSPSYASGMHFAFGVRLYI